MTWVKVLCSSKCHGFNEENKQARLMVGPRGKHPGPALVTVTWELAVAAPDVSAMFDYWQLFGHSAALVLKG